MNNNQKVAKIKIWSRGQITLPVKLRKQMNVDLDAIIFAEPLGEGIYLRPEESSIFKIQKKGEELMRRKGLKIKDIINE